jgi:hypothetical protein
MQLNMYVQCKTSGVMTCKYFSPFDITVNVKGIASHMSVGNLVPSKRFLVACGNVKNIHSLYPVNQISLQC